MFAAVVSSNHRDAWDVSPAGEGGGDSEGKQRARRAWTELLMFPKTVCRQNKRGKRRGQAIAFTRSLRIRWKMGEQQGLWDEAVMAIRKRGQTRSKDNNLEQREADVCRLVSLGRAGQAAKRLVSPGLAESNDVAKQKLLAKFPPNPDELAPRPMQAQPPAPELPLELVFKSLQSFPIGSGPGPDGLRADFLKGIVGQSLDSVSCVGSFKYSWMRRSLICYNLG